MTNVFNAKIFGYLALGYDFIIPNYRGSVGYGAGYVRQLPSHISEKDVSDCFAAMEYATSVKSYDLQYVMGGSHGGFLTGRNRAYSIGCNFKILKSVIFDLFSMADIKREI